MTTGASSFKQFVQTYVQETNFPPGFRCAVCSRECAEGSLYCSVHTTKPQVKTPRIQVEIPDDYARSLPDGVYHVSSIQVQQGYDPVYIDDGLSFGPQMSGSYRSLHVQFEADYRGPS